MNIRKFIHTKNLVLLGVVLIVLPAFVRPDRSDAIPVVKAPQGDFKVRPFSSSDYYNPTLDYYDPKGRFDDRVESEALDDMAVKYIRDPYIRREVASGYWCGTPTEFYLNRYRKPPKAYLQKRAVRMEAKYLNLLANRYLAEYPRRSTR